MKADDDPMMWVWHNISRYDAYDQMKAVGYFGLTTLIPGAVFVPIILYEKRTNLTANYSPRNYYLRYYIPVICVGMCSLQLSFYLFSGHFQRLKQQLQEKHP